MGHYYKFSFSSDPSGITRKSILEYSKNANLIVKEKPFTIEDIKDAEAFSCSSTTLYCDDEIDDCKIGDGCQKAYLKVASIILIM